MCFGLPFAMKALRVQRLPSGQGRILYAKTCLGRRSDHHPVCQNQCVRFAWWPVTFDLGYDDGLDMPKPFRVRIHMISAEMWQHIDRNMVDTKC